MSKWIKTDNFYSLPNKSGLYAIYSKITNELLYIGSSSNIRQRILSGKDTCGFWRISSDLGRSSLFIKYRITDWLFAEKILIRRLQPKYNGSYTSKKIKRNCTNRNRKKYDFGII